jgi:hypothetical protein
MLHVEFKPATANIGLKIAHNHGVGVRVEKVEPDSPLSQCVPALIPWKTFLKSFNSIELLNTAQFVLCLNRAKMNGEAFTLQFFFGSREALQQLRGQEQKNHQQTQNLLPFALSAEQPQAESGLSKSANEINGALGNTNEKVAKNDGKKKTTKRSNESVELAAPLVPSSSRGVHRVKKTVKRPDFVDYNLLHHNDFTGRNRKQSPPPTKPNSNPKKKCSWQRFQTGDHVEAFWDGSFFDCRIEGVREGDLLTSSGVVYDVVYMSGEFEEGVDQTQLRWPVFCKGSTVDYCPESSKVHSVEILHVQTRSMNYKALQKYTIKLGQGSRVEVVEDVEQRYLRRQAKAYTGGMRSRSCMSCDKCLKPDCMACVNCLDSEKYGGPNRLKQRCSDRMCMNKCAPDEWRAGRQKNWRAASAQPIPVKTEKDPNNPRLDMQKGQFIRINYPDQGGWVYGIVTRVFPERNEIEWETEMGELLIEGDIMNKKGKLNTEEVQLSSGKAFARSYKVFPRHEWEDFPCVFIKCGSSTCGKWRKILRSEAASKFKDGGGWICGDADIRTYEDPESLFSCDQPEASVDERVRVTNAPPTGTQQGPDSVPDSPTATTTTTTTTTTTAETTVSSNAVFSMVHKPTTLKTNRTAQRWSSKQELRLRGLMSKYPSDWIRISEIWGESRSPEALRLRGLKLLELDAERDDSNSDCSNVEELNFEHIPESVSSRYGSVFWLVDRRYKTLRWPVIAMSPDYIEDGEFLAEFADDASNGDPFSIVAYIGYETPLLDKVPEKLAAKMLVPWAKGVDDFVAGKIFCANKKYMSVVQKAFYKVQAWSGSGDAYNLLLPQDFKGEVVEPDTKNENEDVNDEEVEEEVDGGKKTKTRCSSCGSYGHNIRTCLLSGTGMESLPQEKRREGPLETSQRKVNDKTVFARHWPFLSATGWLYKPARGLSDFFLFEPGGTVENGKYFVSEEAYLDTLNNRGRTQEEYAQHGDGKINGRKRNVFAASTTPTTAATIASASEDISNPACQDCSQLSQENEDLRQENEHLLRKIALLEAGGGEASKKRPAVDMTTFAMRSPAIKKPKANEEKEEKERKTECSVCMDQERNVVFLPCMHLVCCSDCSPSFEECIFCSTGIEQKLTINML